MIWNKSILSKDKSCKKSCHDLGFQSPNRYESDLLNELLYLLVGQEAAKISEAKVEGRKNLPDQPGPGRLSLESGWVSNFLSTSNFDLWYFCSLLTQKSVATVPHLKDLIHIYLEQEDQDLIWTFKVLYFNVKLPHFTS